MKHELAKTLTLALIDYLDENRSEGTMDCSNGECVSLEKAFTEESFDSVETLINKKLKLPLSPFQQYLSVVLRKAHFIVVSEDELNDALIGIIKVHTNDLLALAKKELARRDEVITLDKLPPYDKGFQDGKAEAMADLERTYFSNPDKLPKWLKDDITRRELNAHTKGYNKGYEVATKLYSAPSFIPYSPLYQSRPLCWEPGGTCTNPQMDCINCPRWTTGGGFNTSSGTSTLKAEEEK